MEDKVNRWAFIGLGVATGDLILAIWLPEKPLSHHIFDTFLYIAGTCGIIALYYLVTD